MKIATKYTLSILFLISCVTIHAQKFGYLNSGQLLLEMPEVKTADSQLESYQKDLIAKGEDMVKKFEQNYNDYVELVNAGTLSKLRMQQREAELGQEQQTIQKYELEVQQKLVVKREELYQPIFDKVKSTVNQIGERDGYTMIFDTSTGSLLHANATQDLLNKVKTALGI